MNPVAVRGVGFVAPGAIGWSAACAALTGATSYAPDALPKLVPDWLPANERRRLSTAMRLAICAGQEAVRTSGIPAKSLATVFASSAGDGKIIHVLCEELAHLQPTVSPTLFHNSVHNAPAGYWSIAARSQRPSTAIAAHDATFAAGLIEAMTMVHETDSEVLLIAYDDPLPFPLAERRAISAPFACALVFTRTSELAASTVRVEIDATIAETRLSDKRLEALRTGNPAARALPLLAAMARAEVGHVAIPYLTGSVLTAHVGGYQKTFNHDRPPSYAR